MFTTLLSVKTSDRGSQLQYTHSKLQLVVLLPLICFASYLHRVSSADTAVSVDPLNGKNVPTCGLSPPCQTITYALRTALATTVLLSEGKFNETSILVDGIASFFSISGSPGKTIFDCGLRGPAFIVANTSIAFANVNFQNCVNFNAASGTGGAISVVSSVLSVTDCAFYNNTALTGGAIGAISSTLTVASSLFENNTATCSNTSTACSAWGGAIGSVEAPSVIISNSTFSRNAVNLELIGLRDGASSTAGGGGCVSVMFNFDVSDSRVSIDGNTFQSCSVRLAGSSGPNAGVQYGNAYGGAVSVYYGIRAASFLRVRNVASTFSNNLCFSTVINSKVGAGGSVYGGCLSMNAGAWSMRVTASSSVGSVVVDDMHITVINNSLENCGALISSGLNAYGGGISVAIGAYSYSGGPSDVSGNTVVINSSFTISDNALTNCTASSLSLSSSSGSSSSGGGVSVAIGAYSYSRGLSSCSSLVLGNTTVSSSSFAMLRNSLTNCIAISSTSSSTVSSSGSNVYGGGVSFAVGAYSYSNRGAASCIGRILGHTNVSRFSCTISSNTLKNCTALTSTLGTSLLVSSSSFGAISYGGCISVWLGASLHCQNPALASEIFGNTSVSSSSYTISSNMLSSCAALSLMSSPASFSSGSNAYGGGVSFAVGAYSYSSRSISASSSKMFGHTTFSSSSYTISSNSLTNCSSLSSTSGTSITAFSSSNGSNAYGGGISVGVGAYSYSSGGSSEIFGDTTVSDSSCIISNNMLARCTASSSSTSRQSSLISSFGSNSYGGGISVAVGAYSYGAMASKVLGNTTVSSSSYTISGNALTNCTASSSTLGTSSSGSNSLGGGVSVAIGAYSYCRVGSSDISGNTIVGSSSYTITDTTLTNCIALSLTTSSSSLSSSGANSYGGGVSVAVGAYSYSRESDNLVSGYTAVSSSSYTVSGNALTNCTASSLTTSPLFSTSSSFSSGSNSYGGGVSVAVGAYSYSRDASSFLFGRTTVSSSSCIISNNTLAICTASTLTSSLSSSSSSSGAYAYGGGVSVLVGAYSYSSSRTASVGSLIVVSFTLHFFNVSCVNCISSSSTSGLSRASLAYGGAVSASFESFVYPKVSNPLPATSVSSTLQILRCNFSKSVAFTSSLSCSPGGSSAAGGAMFVSLLSADVVVFGSIFADASVQTGCAASSSQTHSLGGGLFIFRAREVTINATNVTYCRSIGVSQANNVLVSGGGIFVQDTESVTLESVSVSASSVENAFSVRLLPCGGGAIGINNVSALRVSNSKVHNNSDSSSSGVILLRQLTSEPDLVLNITDGSVLSTDPSISTALPVLNISCGTNCSVMQQSRMYINVARSTLLAQNLFDQSYESAVVVALPRWSLVSAVNSYIRCNFTSVDSIAALIVSSADRKVVTCAPCKSFHIAMTSHSMNLSIFSTFAAQSETRDSCQLSTSKSSDGQICPYGMSSCSTVAKIAVGFWTNFGADGSIGDAIRCPSNYCGCRNILGYSESTCQLFPPFAEEYQPDDALCSGNRTGVLCGGCRPNFTQSLNGYSCIPNGICSETLPWVWTVTVIGYIIYAVYIVITSMAVNSGMVMCVLFYGQLASFASLPSQLVDESENTEISALFSKVTQFGSILSVYGNACYGLNMGAFEATAAQLSGPAIVLSATLLLTAVAKRLMLRLSYFLQKFNFEAEISFGATIINVLLLLFSSASSVIFQLITCQQVGTQKVVFIDGRRECEGSLHRGLVALAVLLSLMPFAFWALLKSNKFPSVRDCVCSAYIGTRYYWGAVALLFRFLMTVIFATARDFPSITAFGLLICSVCMLVLLIMMRPYVEQRSYHLDVFCHVCLIVQFALQVLIRNSESLGVAVPVSNSFRPVLLNAAKASNVLRYMPIVICVFLILLQVVTNRLWSLGLISSRYLHNRPETVPHIDSFEMQSMRMRTVGEDASPMTTINVEMKTASRDSVSLPIKRLSLRQHSGLL